MAQFTGGRRVRCVDCLYLQGNKCTGRKKTPTVSPKKKRDCATYSFKGEYQNSTPLEAVYLPHIDPKTKKLMKKLMKLGVVSVTDRDLEQGGMRKIQMPASTATAQLLGTEITTVGVDSIDPGDTVEEKKSFLWTPDSGKEEEDE